MQSAVIASFTSGERDYIRGQLDRFFSTLPTVAEGFQLKTWRGGPEAGKPKLPPTAKGLVERGLMRLDTEEHLRRLFFTETGLAMLREMMAARRFAHRKNSPMFAKSSASTAPELGRRFAEALLAEVHSLYPQSNPRVFGSEGEAIGLIGRAAHTLRG